MTQFGRYVILNEIGRGGFATVYKAHDTRLKRTVALKILHAGWSADSDFVRRFQQEAETIANLKHPNIVVVYDVGEIERQLYIAMEYLAGENLQAWMKKVDGPLLAADCLPILRPVAGALDYAHSRGIIHRDIKPSNIMRDESGQTLRIVLTDFGLVKAMEHSVAQTKSSQMLGSPAYMAPEQADPNRSDEISTQSDLYAFGIIAYQMLAGRVPFPGESINTLYAHVNLPVPDPQQLNPELSDEVVAILSRMLAKTPAERYPSALAFVDALQATWETTPEKQVIPLYAQLQHAQIDAAWVQVLTLATQIELLLPGYRDVAAIKAQASHQLQALKTLVKQSPSLVETISTKHARMPEATAQPPEIVPKKQTTIDPPAEKRGIPMFWWIVGGVVGIAIIGFLLWRIASGDVPQLKIGAASETVAQSPSLGSSWQRLADEMVMAYVPGGSFMMGSDPSVDPDALDKEQPQHKVTLDRFWIDKTEVTNAQYNLCVEAGNCEISTYANNAVYNGDDYPVVGVSWFDAKGYCEWAGGQLPTEAQWEYAARGDGGFLYPWGNKFDGNSVNFCDTNCPWEEWKDDAFDDGYAEIAPVGSYPTGVSWIGALDMAGNVWEWTQDWYADYNVNPSKPNPTGPATGERKVLRGGGWFSNAQGMRTADRGRISPLVRDGNVGFRCAAPGK